MRIYIETIVSVVVLAALGVVASHEFAMTSNTMMYMTAQVACGFGLLGLLALFLLEEKGDERTIVHQKIASRMAYFFGLTVSSVAIIYQSIHHVIDPWILVIIGCMLLGKIIGRMYSLWKN
jgi:peptidoglycan/LPS O-acetylase OafA/YrhL